VTEVGTWAGLCRLAQVILLVWSYSEAGALRRRVE